MISIVSYNVLSSTLCTHLHFPWCDPLHCDADYRFHVLLEFLSAQISREGPAVIFCLQEVSLDYAQRLESYFAEHDYSFTVSNTLPEATGWMGEATAFPLALFQLVSVDVSCLGANLAKSELFVSSELENGSSALQQVTSQPTTLVSVRLCHLVSNQMLLVSNYHCPNLYRQPPYMTLHIALALEHVEKIAFPIDNIILCGDFNVKPASPQYLFITTLQLPPIVDDPNQPIIHGKPTLPPNLALKPQLDSLLRPYTSAYAKAGKEPPFTNYAKTVNKPEGFSATLDYIFFDENRSSLRCVSVDDLHEPIDEILSNNIASLPSATQMSDHLPLIARFEFI